MACLDCACFSSAWSLDHESHMDQEWWAPGPVSWKDRVSGGMCRGLDQHGAKPNQTTQNCVLSSFNIVYRYRWNALWKYFQSNNVYSLVEDVCFGNCVNRVLINTFMHPLSFFGSAHCPPWHVCVLVCSRVHLWQWHV